MISKFGIGEFLLLAGTSVPLAAETPLPDWFWTPVPQEAVVVFASSEASALQRAPAVLQAYRDSFVEGDYQRWFDAAVDHRAWQNTDYHYVYDGAAAAALGPRLRVWDREPLATITGLWVYLVGEGPPPVGVPRSARSLGQTPAWSEDYTGDWADAGRWGAVGRFPSWANPADAWVKAEELAVFELLSRVSFDLRHIEKTSASRTPGDAKIDWVRLHYSIGGLRIDRRWIDLKTGDYMVAVSAPQNRVRVIP